MRCDLGLRQVEPVAHDDDRPLSVWQTIHDSQQVVNLWRQMRTARGVASLTSPLTCDSSVPVPAPVDHRSPKIRRRIDEFIEMAMHTSHRILGKILGDVIATRQQMSQPSGPVELCRIELCEGLVSDCHRPTTQARFHHHIIYDPTRTGAVPSSIATPTTERRRSPRNSTPHSVTTAGRPPRVSLPYLAEALRIRMIARHEHHVGPSSVTDVPVGDA